jgi:pimeloyl-ACP methyl ester carboxylesterase
VAQPVAIDAVNSTNVRSVPAQLRVLRAGLGAVQAVSPPLAAAWGERLFRTPRRFPTPPRERAWLEAATPFTVTAGDDLLPAWSWGDGPAVVLVHGWEGRGSQMGALALGLAADGLRAVAFDAPGHGGARSRLGSLPQIAAGIAAVVDAVGPVRAVVGHSFGGAAACWAVARGLPVERLALISPPFDLDPYVTGFGAALGASPRTIAGLVERIERRFDVDWQEARRPAVAGAGRAPETRVLVVHDREDDETPWAGGAAVARAWPHGEIVTTKGLGHRRILRSAEVVERIARFAGG